MATAPAPAPVPPPATPNEMLSTLVVLVAMALSAPATLKSVWVISAVTLLPAKERATEPTAPAVPPPPTAMPMLSISVLPSALTDKSPVEAVYVPPVI